MSSDAITGVPATGTIGVIESKFCLSIIAFSTYSSYILSITFDFSSSSYMKLLLSTKFCIYCFGYKAFT